MGVLIPEWRRILSGAHSIAPSALAAISHNAFRTAPDILTTAWSLIPSQGAVGSPMTSSEERRVSMSRKIASSSGHRLVLSESSCLSEQLMGFLLRFPCTLRTYSLQLYHEYAPPSF